MSIGPSDVDIGVPSWTGILSDAPPVNIDHGRLRRFEDRISEATVRRVRADRTTVDQIIKGRMRLASPGTKDDAHQDDGVRWAYWTFMCVRDGFRVIPLLNRPSPVREFILQSKKLQVVQFGGGPAEDLVGILELCESWGTLNKRIKYLSIDVVDWTEHLDVVRGHVKDTYRSQDVVVDQMLANLDSVHANTLATRIDPAAATLVLVANLLVSEGRTLSHPKLPAIVARLAGLITNIVGGSALVLIEPNSQAARLSTVLDSLNLNSITDRLKINYMPSRTEMWDDLHQDPKRMRQKAIAACALLTGSYSVANVEAPPP